MRSDGPHDKEKILDYWNEESVQSMYDKHLIDSEIGIIRKYMPINSKVLDAGCGEGEGTLNYSSIEGIKLHAVDFSDTRLQKAAIRLSGCKNVEFKKVDFLDEYILDNDYDAIVSQRFLINLMEWELQQKVILDFMSMLKPGGRLIMLEGSMQGVKELNDLRLCFGLEPIDIKWHNLFFDDCALIDFMNNHSYKLIANEGLGGYFLLTRGIRPYFDKTLNWDCEFNKLAASCQLKGILNFGNTKFSRLKLWVFIK